MPRPAARTRDETTRALINAARAIIDELGEERLRVTDVARRAGVTAPVIHQHFGDRHGLVTAARLDKVEGLITGDIARIEEALSGLELTQDRDGLLRLVAAAGLRPVSEGVVWDRIELLAASRHNPIIAKRLGEFQAQLTDRFCAAIDRAKAIGVVDPAIDSRAIAVFAQAYTLGRVLGDLGADAAPSPADWSDLIVRFLRGLAPPQS
jgi:AcrR family transcriptional regulator